MNAEDIPKIEQYDPITIVGNKVVPVTGIPPQMKKRFYTPEGLLRYVKERLDKFSEGRPVRLDPTFFNPVVGGSHIVYDVRYTFAGFYISHSDGILLACSSLEYHPSGIQRVGLISTHPLEKIISVEVLKSK